MSIRGLIPWQRRGDSYAPSTLSLVRRDPLQSLHNEVDRMFNEVFRLNASGQPWAGGGAEIWPKIEIADEEKEVRITADMPGMEQKDIDVSLEDGVLTLKGEKRSETENKDLQFSERFYGRFERRIPIGYELDEDKIDAHFDNGVLKIVLPKNESAASKPKRVEIKT